ncbi:MAG: hypothetical protein P8J01_03270 [Acidimicrobiales bacterium]|nr:hypothetical protein [Acidimicrobiales bacterium]
MIQPSEELDEALHNVFDIEASDEEHLNYVRQVFFASGMMLRSGSMDGMVL